jgi:succinyl-diaminopimelate desuccinylase
MTGQPGVTAPSVVPDVAPEVADVVLHAADLVELTAGLVNVPSVSRAEQALADLVESRLRSRAPGLSRYRIGNNVVARTERGGVPRLVFAGHLDTVPVAGPAGAVAGTDQVAGRGAVDMKGGLAVMLLLTENIADSPFDCTFIFYDKEEIGFHQSGMHLLFAERPDLCAADLAFVLEPTNCSLEAGGQGNLVAEAHFHGQTAHSARPWRGRNAVTRAVPALTRVTEFTPEKVQVDGLVYPPALSVVGIEGGRQGNMVPDHCKIAVNYRHAPTVTTADAIEFVRQMMPDADEIRVILRSPPALPRLDHPLIARFRDLGNLVVRPKLGWTDVARFAQHGIAAVNFGPGDAEQAHTPHEIVKRNDLERCREVLGRFMADAVPAG